jgi:hypothetical protein
VDEEVKDVCAHVYEQSCPNADDTVLEYLDKMAKQLNVVLSHNAKGDLLLTKVKADKKLTTKETKVNADLDHFNPSGPNDTVRMQASGVQTTQVEEARPVLYDFDGANNKWLDIEHEFNGAGIHSDVVVLGQGEEKNPNGVQSDPEFSGMFDSRVQTWANKWAKANNVIGKARGIGPRTYVQTSGDEFTVQKTARAILGDELKGVCWMISIHGWTLNGHMVTPNQMVTAHEAEVYLYKRRRLFIQEVHLFRNEEKERAMLRCVLPECFNSDPIKDIY